MDIPKIKKLTPMEGYRLKLEYVNGVVNIFDVKPYIYGPWFSELGDEEYFKQVRIIDDGEGIEWPHGQNLAPHELYGY